MNSKSTLKQFIQDFFKLLLLLALLSLTIYLYVKIPLLILYVILAFLIGWLYRKLRPGKEIITVEGVRNFLKAIAWLYINIWVAQASRYLFQLSAATSLTWPQISLLGLWGILLFGALWLLSIEKQREKFFAWIRKLFGGWAPFLCAFTLLYVATGFFGSVTYLLVKNNLLPWTPADQKITADQIADFYLWHFVDAIPVLKVNSTLLWEQPLTYDNGGIGFLLLLFKIVVISPVIASFFWYRQFVAKEKKKEESKGAPQKIVYRIYRPKRRRIHL